VAGLTLETIAAAAADERGALATTLLASEAWLAGEVWGPLCGEPCAAGMEAIYEGYLLHYGVPRVVRTREADLRVLAGDRLYAIGLARLVELGDTAAVAELADTITLSALAQGAGDGPLAEAVWAAGARAVGWGASEQHRRAKRLVADRSPDAIEAMRTSALPAPGTP
jgi:hypothetical protein